MIQQKLIDFIAEKTRIEKLFYIEKDLILHRLLTELSLNKHFSENYAFKGGTCLMKCYLGYYRFSEDLDFTYINQSVFTKKTRGQKEKILSEEMNKVGELIEGIANKIGLDFKQEKSNRRYFLFGGGGRQATFNLWYVPNGEAENFIKIQINFVDKLLYPVKKIHANNLFFGNYENFEKEAFLLPENSEWLLKIPKLKVYDLREILIEKVRAVLTRKGVKARDFVDIFMIVKAKRIKLESIKKQVIEKTELMLKLYGKYSENIAHKNFEQIDKLVIGEEERLMIKPLPEGFNEFLKEFKDFLKEIIKEVMPSKQGYKV